ncbi:MAG: hypothetical protein WA151_20895 [Desulfatirhabdiaceae bacterium]
MENIEIPFHFPESELQKGFHLQHGQNINTGDVSLWNMQQPDTFLQQNPYNPADFFNNIFHRLSRWNNRSVQESPALSTGCIPYSPCPSPHPTVLHTPI